MSDKQIIREIFREETGHIIEVKVAYSLGGLNAFTMRQEPRGYWLHVTPEKRENGFRTFTAFSGVKKFLLPVTRKSKKKLEEAVAMVTDDMIDQMIAQCKFD